MPDMNEFSIKMLDLMGDKADKKMSVAKLDKYVPKITKLVNEYLFEGRMVNTKIFNIKI